MRAAHSKFPSNPTSAPGTSNFYHQSLIHSDLNYANIDKLFRSVENLLNKEGDNAPGIPIGASVAHCANEGLLATIDGRRRISSCSGYSTATGKI